MNQYSDPTKQFAFVEGHENLVVNATFYSGKVIVWYKDEKSAKDAVELFHDQPLGDYKEILAFETSSQQDSGKFNVFGVRCDILSITVPTSLRGYICLIK
jgi:hypothetical protein